MNANLFNDLVSNLTIDDMVVLGYLSDEKIDTVYKSIRKKLIKEETKMTTATFNRVLLRLEAIKFIGVDKSSKEHKVYITEYGEKALKYQIQKEEI